MPVVEVGGEGRGGGGGVDGAAAAGGGGGVAAEVGRAGAAVVLNAVGGARGVTVAAGEIFLLGPLGPLITRSGRAVGRGVVDAVQSGLRCATIPLRRTHPDAMSACVHSSQQPLV